MFGILILVIRLCAARRYENIIWKKKRKITAKKNVYDWWRYKEDDQISGSGSGCEVVVFSVLCPIVPGMNDRHPNANKLSRCAVASR